MRTFLILFFVFVFFPLGPALADSITGRVRVVDADTLHVAGEKIRLDQIDAPESRQSCLDAQSRRYACGKVATEKLWQWLSGASVSCKVSGRDRYGRAIAKCSANGRDVGEWLVSNGYALAYRRYGKDYVSAENRARTAKAGIWQGQFVAPWDWRRGAR